MILKSKDPRKPSCETAGTSLRPSGSSAVVYWNWYSNSHARAGLNQICRHIHSRSWTIDDNTYNQFPKNIFSAFAQWFKARTHRTNCTPCFTPWLFDRKFVKLTQILLPSGNFPSPFSKTFFPKIKRYRRRFFFENSDISINDKVGLYTSTVIMYFLSIFPLVYGIARLAGIVGHSAGKSDGIIRAPL